MTQLESWKTTKLDRKKVKLKLKFKIEVEVEVSETPEMLLSTQLSEPR